MTVASRERAAIAAVSATADLIAQGGHPGHGTEAHELLHETDLPTVAFLAALIVHVVGEPARDALRGFGLAAADDPSARR